MSVTIKDIARESGVSYSTVSKALNNSPLVKPETKKKVLETANMLGYTPNFAAKNLVSKKSRTIGLVWPAIDRIALTALVSKINELVTAENYFMILSVDEADKAIGMFKDSKWTAS
jgi:LacI family transcriptional regulator